MDCTTSDYRCGISLLNAFNIEFNILFAIGKVVHYRGGLCSNSFPVVFCRGVLHSRALKCYLHLSLKWYDLSYHLILQ